MSVSPSSKSSTVKSCLNILRRTPPQDVEQNLTGLLSLLENDDEANEELLQRVDVGLRSIADPKAENNKKFIICDHNRDGESYRSPWTNSYYNEEGQEDNNQEGLLKPSDRLRNLEIVANEVFDSYRKLYYGSSAVNSVYLWDNFKDNGGFSACFLIQNDIQDASWNSIHVVDVTILDGHSSTQNKKAMYKLTTTIQLSVLPNINIDKESNKKTTYVGGTLTNQKEQICPIPSSNNDNNDMAHIINIGKMLEEMETDMRSNMDVLYLQKTREIVDCIYTKEKKRVSSTGTGTSNQQQHHTTLLNQALLARMQKK